MMTSPIFWRIGRKRGNYHRRGLESRLYDGRGPRAKVWEKIMLSPFRLKLAPIFSVHTDGRRMTPDIPEAELDRIKATARAVAGHSAASGRAAVAGSLDWPVGGKDRGGVRPPALCGGRAPEEGENNAFSSMD